MQIRGSFAVGALCAALIAVISLGCGKPTGNPNPPAKAKTNDAKHAGWWCDEHGVPEAECSMCSGKVAKACKTKGDWCAEHDRAKSQCFICDSSLWEKYKAVYKAKTGKEPPEPTDNMPGKPPENLPPG
jgi:hypothetical protein